MEIVLLQVPELPNLPVFENPESGASVKDFLEWYPEVDEWQIAAVPNHEAESLRASAIR